MREQGRLTDWNDDRGFGFITPLSGGVTVFAHVSQFPRDLRRPEVLDLVSYVLASDDGGRLQAHEVQFMAPTRARATPDGAPAHLPSTVPALAVGVVAVAAAALLTRSWGPPIAYCVMSLVTFAAYGLDKRAARMGRFRTEESALHALALVGGWPGALVGQAFFRHKTIKQPFRTIFWVTVVANMGLLWLLVAADRTG